MDPAATAEVTTAEDLRGRARGALVGLAVGDALGMPTRGMSPAGVEEEWGTLRGFAEALPPRPAAAGTPAATVTRGTGLALGIARRHLRLAPAPDGQDPLTVEPTDPPQTVLVVAGAALGVAIPCDPIEPFARAVADALAAVAPDRGATRLEVAGACAVAGAVSAGLAGADAATALGLALLAADAGAALGRATPGPDLGTRINWACALAARAQDDDPASVVDVLVGTSAVPQECVAAGFALTAAYPDDPWAAGLAGARLGGDSSTVASIAGVVLGARLGVDAFPPDAVDRVVARNPRTALYELADALAEARGT